MKTRNLTMLAMLGGLAPLLVGGCGERGPRWDAPLDSVQPFALLDAVAITDPAEERVVLLTTDDAQAVSLTSVGIQRGMQASAVAPDRSKLFVVSAGDGDGDGHGGAAPQTPALEIVTRAPAARARYPLSEALTGLALDPRGAWAVLFADDTSTSLVRNPNELLLVDLSQPASAANPISHTLRSFGGKPQRFTFTDPLELPGGTRRLLVVETEQDVAIIDLLHPAEPEITIQLSSGQDARQLHPAGVVVTDGDAGPNDARLAIRVDDSSVVVATLAPTTGRDFSPTLNLTDVGGIPSDAAWVRTDAGALALAVLVPTASKAVVVDPTTGLTVDVALPAAYRSLSLVTAQSGAGDPATAAVDVALLWNGPAGGVSFWELGRVAGQPYRSVETVGVTEAVTSVRDVSGIHPELKILGTRGSDFFLLDLKARTSAPFLTSLGEVGVLPSTTGDRAWVFEEGAAQLAAVDLQTLHPEAMRTELPIWNLFEIAATGPTTTARSLVALDQAGTWGATVYDATAATHPDNRTIVTGILLEAIHAP
ncbi:MAG TPA: hypothetical protein VGP07_11275 [Polyangia bacterium]|jgi:hypothetical protein